MSGPHETFNCLLIEHEVGVFLCLQVFGQLLILLVRFFGWQLVFLLPPWLPTPATGLCPTQISAQTFFQVSPSQKGSKENRKQDVCKDNADDPICLHAADICHKSPGEAEVSRNYTGPGPRASLDTSIGIKGEFHSSYATQTSKICFTYFLHSDRCQNIHTSSVHSRLRVEWDRSQHDYTTMNVADIKFLLRVQKAETIDFNDTSPLSVMTHPPPRVLGWVLSQSEDSMQTAWPIRGRDCDQSLAPGLWSLPSESLSLTAETQ